MWNTISSISSGFALAAFIAAGVVETLRRMLRSRELQIAKAPEHDRLAMAQALSDAFLISGRPIETSALTKQQQYSIIVTQIRDRARRFYLLAAMLTALAVCALMTYAVSQRIGGGEIKGGARERAMAVSIWQKFYRQEFDALYEGLSDHLKTQIRYQDVLLEFKRQVAQFPRAPLSRRLEYEGANGGYWLVSHLVEFDGASTFREITTFSRDDSMWQAYRMDIQPVEWPMSSTSKLLTKTADQIVRGLSKLAPAALAAEVDQQFKGQFIPPPGWGIVIDGVSNQRGDLTCDVDAHDPISQAHIVVQQLLGGCALSKGAEITILGRLCSADGQKIEVDSVRFVK